jgi:hypothetical protein
MSQGPRVLVLLGSKKLIKHNNWLSLTLTTMLYAPKFVLVQSSTQSRLGAAQSSQRPRWAQRLASFQATLGMSELARFRHLAIIQRYIYMRAEQLVVVL